MSESPSTSWTSGLARIRRNFGHILGGDDHAHLIRLAKDFRAEQAWEEIQRQIQKRPQEWSRMFGELQYFVLFMVGTRRSSEEVVSRHRRYREIITQTEEFITQADRIGEFLQEPMHSALLPSKTIDGLRDVRSSLEHILRAYRDFASGKEVFGTVPPSRKDQKGSRRVKFFISEMRNYMRAVCGTPLDEVVRVFSEVAFDREVTIEQIQAAQRPTTGIGRSRKRK